MSVLDVIIYIGIFVFACTGALKARAYHMDIFGGLVMALVMAFGGGMARDILMGIRVSWLNDNLSLILMLSAVVVTFLFKRRLIRYKKMIFILDAFGLGLYTVAGIEAALRNGINKPYSVLLGVITATFGGLIADIISNTVPALLKRGELYATASTFGGIFYIVLPMLGFGANINMFVCILTVVLIRIISKWKRLMLPDI